MNRPLMALLISCVVCLCVASADDKPTPPAKDPVAEALTKAKEAYQEAMKAAGEKLVKAFEAEDKKAEKDTKLTPEQYSKLSKQLAEERKAFEADPTKLPDSPAMKGAKDDYQKVAAAARKKCETAFDAAAQAYRGKDNMAMEAVLAQKKEFFKGGPVAPPKAGPFVLKAGQVFVGKRINSSGDTFDLRLEVVKVEKDKFTGTVKFTNDTVGRPVTGTLDGGKFSMLVTSEPGSKFMQDYAGTLKGDTLTLTWTGITTTGKSASGTATATLKPEEKSDKSQLEKALADTKWKWPDQGVSKAWFVLNADGTVTAGWHNKPGKWTAINGTTIEAVIMTSNRTPITLVFDPKADLFRQKDKETVTFPRVK